MKLKVQLTLVFGIICITNNIVADGYFLVYNNSLYNIKLVVTSADAVGNITMSQSPVIPLAPTNTDGSLQVHSADQYYQTGSNVPVGTVTKVNFTGTAKNFDLQILNSAGSLMRQINVGTSLGTVVDNDPARVAYVYSNVDNSGKAVANSGGVVYFWDQNHSLQSPSQQSFAQSSGA